MKKWINKQTVIAFMLGALIFTSVPASAAIVEYICYKADYKVMVNGEQYISDDLPILNYKGNTYAPFRSVLEAAGLNVNWNTELKQAEVSAPKELSTPEPKYSPVAPEDKLPEEQELLEPEPELEPDPELIPQEDPTSEPQQEPMSQSIIGDIFALMNGERQIIVYFPESMNASDVLSLSSYGIYLEDKATLAQTQASSVQYDSSQNKATLLLSQDLAPEKDIYSLGISENVRNADGTKIVGARDKMLFAYPYTDTPNPDGTTTRTRGSN